MNRRGFLAASGMATATALSGCLGILDGNGSGSGDSGYDAVTRWTVPARNDGGQGDGFRLLSRSASRMLELDEHVSMDLEAALDRATSYVWGDVDPADLEREIEIKSVGDLSHPYYKVFTGSFDVENAREALADASDGDPGSYEGFDVYRGVSPETSFDDTERVYAVGNGAVVQSGGVLGNAGTVDQIHRVVDAVEGNTDRRTDQHDGLAEVASHVEPGATTQLETSDPDQETDATMGQFRGVTATGTYAIVDGETIQLTIVYAYESAGAVDTAALEEFVTADASTRQVDSLSYEVDGDVVTITGSVDAQQFLSQ